MSLLPKDLLHLMEQPPLMEQLHRMDQLHRVKLLHQSRRRRMQQLHLAEPLQRIALLHYAVPPHHTEAVQLIALPLECPIECDIDSFAVTMNG